MRLPEPVWVPAPDCERVFRKSLTYPFVSSFNLLNHLVRPTVSCPLYRWQNKTKDVNMLKFIARKLKLPDIRAHVLPMGHVVSFFPLTNFKPLTSNVGLEPMLAEGQGRKASQ